jgi:hypothetical protein
MCKRHFGERDFPELDTTLFRRPERGQLDLFGA